MTVSILRDKTTGGQLKLQQSKSESIVFHSHKISKFQHAPAMISSPIICWRLHCNLTYDEQLSRDWQ